MVKIDADHGLAETFFKIRSGTCRKNVVLWPIFLLRLCYAARLKKNRDF